MKYYKNKGFTLIELMITVAIVGILSSIAVSAYRDYIIRAQMSEGLLLAENAKNNIITYYEVEGELPIDNEDAAFESITGKYINNVEISDGVISATFSKDSPYKSHNELDGAVLQLIPDVDEVTHSLTWHCDLIGSKTRYLPASCK